MTSRPVAALSSASKSFGPVEVLQGVNLALRAGSVHALIGEDGAGKSTTMMSLAGYQPPSKGLLSWTERLSISAICKTVRPPGS